MKMAHRHSIVGTSAIALPLDALIFLGVLAPLLCFTTIAALPAITSAILVLGWCLMLGAQALYSALALNTRISGHALKPGHLAAMLEAECDDDRHHRRLRMLGVGLNLPNIFVMISAGMLGLAAFGPLWGMAGPALVYALAVHSYTRPVRYGIWCMSAFALGYAGLLALPVGQAPIALLKTDIAGAQLIAHGLCAFIAVLAYRLTIIANLRHIAALAFVHTGLCATLITSIAGPVVTNLVTLSCLLFAPGLCALSAKTVRHCRHRLYGYGDHM